MDAGAYQSLVQLNIKPVVTEILNIVDAFKAVIEVVTIIDHSEKVH